jgi:hypothetical protein
MQLADGGEQVKAVPGNVMSFKQTCWAESGGCPQRQGSAPIAFPGIRSRPRLRIMTTRVGSQNQLQNTTGRHVTLVSRATLRVSVCRASRLPV